MNAKFRKSMSAILASCCFIAWTALTHAAVVPATGVYSPGFSSPFPETLGQSLTRIRHALLECIRREIAAEVRS